MERLTNLADILRKAGCNVEEVPNWKLTSRNDDRSVYLPGRPTHFMHHHTASSVLSHSTHDRCKREALLIQTMEPNEPIANLALCPHGVWFTVCAGPSNTNGVGTDTWHPVGDSLKVPDNSMNSYAIANEMMNNGVDERYPDVMIQALVVGTAAVCIAFGIGVFENRGHFEWAPNRKIDPASYCKYTRLSDPQHRWDMGKFRTDIHNEIVKQLTPPAQLPVFEGDEEMFDSLWMGPNDPGVYKVITNGTKVWCYPGTVDDSQALLRLAGKSDQINVCKSADMFRAFGPVIGPKPGGVDEYGWKDA